MRISIIGAGNIGSTLARHWAVLGHDVTIANSRGPDTLRDVAARTGARPVTVEEAVGNAELVVISIPQKAVAALPKPLFAGLGPDVIAGDRPHYVVGAHEWQAAVPLPGKEGYTLASCVVTPGFKFSGFTLAPPNWRPGAEPSGTAAG